MKKWFPLYVFFLFSGTITAQTSSLTLFPTDDVYTYKGNTGTGNEIRGMESTLQSYRNPASQEYWWSIPYLKFDLQKINFLVDKVKFRLYGTVNEAHTFDIYKTSLTGWAEDALTFNNASSQVGSISTNPIASLDVTGSTTAQYYEWDLTEAVIQAINNGENYLSLKFQDRYAVKTSTGAGIIVRFHSKENISGNKPQLLITEKDITTFALSELTLDNALIEGFVPTKVRYDIQLPYNSTAIPVVNAVAENPLAALKITNAQSLTGSETERTARIVSTIGQDSVIFKVVFRLSASPDVATIDSLFTEGKSIENFKKDSTYYRIYLPYTATTSPAIELKTTDKYATSSITAATNIFGTVAERTAIVEVTSQDKTNIKKYYIEFEPLPKLDIFLALGQSNMAGRGTMTPDDLNPIDNVYLLTPYGNLEIASNPLNKYSSIRKELSMQQMSPSCSFSQTIRDAVGVNIGIMQNARGGSAISSWRKGSPDRYYEEAIRRALEIQKFGEIKGIIWHQGESDSGDPNGYKTKLSKMVSDFRTDLNNPRLFFIAGEIAKWTGNQAFNTMIQTVASFIPYSDWASSDGLTPLIDTSDPHFDAPSVKVLGERYAQKMLKGAYQLSGITQNNASHLSQISTSKNQLNVEVKDKKVALSVYDISGKQIESKELSSNSNFSCYLTSGCYIVKISDQNKDTHITKIIII